MSDPILLPCPFCGGLPVLFVGSTQDEYQTPYAYVSCVTCGVAGPDFPYQDEAVGHWDARYPFTVVPTVQTLAAATNTLSIDGGE